MLGIKESAIFTLLVTILAVIELLLFMGIVAPGFKMENFMHNNMPFGVQGIFAALPFAVWFYLGKTLCPINLAMIYSPLPLARNLI